MTVELYWGAKNVLKNSHFWWTWFDSCCAIQNWKFPGNFSFPQLLFERFWNLLLCCSKGYKVIKLFSDVIEQCVLFVIISTSEVGTHLQKNYFSVSMFCNSCEQSLLTLLDLRVTKIIFLLTISIQNQEKRLQELVKCATKGNCFDNLMYRDQSGEFVCGYWGLKG